MNSAAHVSTFLNTGNILRAILFRLTISSELLVNSDSFLSEKPIDFILLNSLKSFGNPFFLILVSLSTISLIWSKNHGSILDKVKILFKLIFFLIASATSKILFGIFSFNFFSIWFLFKSKILSKPEKLVSRETYAFWSDSLKFLPIAIVSPTDFIEVPRVAGEVENFSKVNLGILVTT